jgi:hypothetical protein
MGKNDNDVPVNISKNRASGGVTGHHVRATFSPSDFRDARRGCQIERRRTRALDGRYEATGAAMRCANRPLNCRGLAIYQSSPSLA